MYKTFAVVFIISLLLSQVASAQATQLERDPTRPINYQVASGNSGGPRSVKLNLSSVLISAQRKVAIINGQSLHEGQAIPGSAARLLSIHSQGVWIEESGSRRELRLAPSIIKKN